MTAQMHRVIMARGFVLRVIKRKILFTAETRRTQRRKNG
jgi:hypothetical protein